MYNDFNNNFFNFDPINSLEDILGLGFSKPISIRFLTPDTKDVSPVSSWKKDGNKYYAVVRVVGIDPDDVKVALDEKSITVSGESETFGETYSQHVVIGVSPDIISNIDSVTYEVKSGMCRIDLIMKEKEIHRIDVKRIGAKDAKLGDTKSNDSTTKEDSVSIKNPENRNKFKKHIG